LKSLHTNYHTQSICHKVRIIFLVFEVIMPFQGFYIILLPIMVMDTMVDVLLLLDPTRWQKGREIQARARHSNRSSDRLMKPKLKKGLKSFRLKQANPQWDRIQKIGLLQLVLPENPDF
jgi:hypothetical protein